MNKSAPKLFTNIVCATFYAQSQSHEAEIVLNEPMIDQSTFLHYPFSIFRINVTSSSLVSPSYQLEDLDLFVFPNSDLLLEVHRELLTLACGLITRANIIELTELIR